MFVFPRGPRGLLELQEEGRGRMSRVALVAWLSRMEMSGPIPPTERDYVCWLAPIHCKAP